MNTDAVQSGELKVIAHIGGNSIVEIIELAKHAETWSSLKGFQGVAVFTPSYYKPVGEQQVAEYLIRVAQEVPNVPVYYYHFPANTGVEVSVCDQMVAAKVVESVGMCCSSCS